MQLTAVVYLTEILSKYRLNKIFLSPQTENTVKSYCQEGKKKTLKAFKYNIYQLYSVSRNTAVTVELKHSHNFHARHENYMLSVSVESKQPEGETEMNDSISLKRESL